MYNLFSLPQILHFIQKHLLKGMMVHFLIYFKIKLIQTLWVMLKFKPWKYDLFPKQLLLIVKFYPNPLKKNKKFYTEVIEIIVFINHPYLLFFPYDQCSGNAKSWLETVIEHMVGRQGQPKGTCNGSEWWEQVEPGSIPSQTSFKGWQWRSLWTFRPSESKQIIILYFSVFSVIYNHIPTPWNLRPCYLAIFWCYHIALLASQAGETAVYILRMDYLKGIICWLVTRTRNTPKKELLGFLSFPECWSDYLRTGTYKWQYQISF